MDDVKYFFGFRGNIEFKDELNLFNYDVENNSENKNKIFTDLFEKLAENKIFGSKYNKRQYLLIFCNKYDNIVHCRLARKKEYLKHELIGANLIEKMDNDYPNINIFIELKSQKFLIESNYNIFENYNTCRDVLKNIMNSNFNNYNAYIEIESIVEETSFWSSFDNKIPVYSIEFSLNAPNLFNSDSIADQVMKSANKDVNANTVELTFKNKTSGLKPNREGIGSFVKYACNGGGKWKQKVLGENGKIIIISSKQRSKRISIHTKGINGIYPLPFLTINEIISKFSEIEDIERFK